MGEQQEGRKPGNQLSCDATVLDAQESRQMQVKDGRRRPDIIDAET